MLQAEGCSLAFEIVTTGQEAEEKEQEGRLSICSGIHRVVKAYCSFRLKRSHAPLQDICAVCLSFLFVWQGVISRDTPGYDFYNEESKMWSCVSLDWWQVPGYSDGCFHGLRGLRKTKLSCSLCITPLFLQDHTQRTADGVPAKCPDRDTSCCMPASSPFDST